MLKGIIALVIFALVIATTHYAKADDDTYIKIQEMVNDLGPAPERAKNIIQLGIE